MWVVLGFVALLALAGMVVFLSRCPVMIQTTRERETMERVVQVVTPPPQVHHVHHVHHVQAATAAPHTYVAPAQAATQGPLCPCGCGLPLGDVPRTPAIAPTPDTVAAVGRVVPAPEGPQR